MHQLTLHQLKQIYIPTAVATLLVISLGTILASHPLQVAADPASTQSTPTQKAEAVDQSKLVVPIKNKETSAQLSLAILQAIRKNRTMSDATAGKLYSKILPVASSALSAGDATVALDQDTMNQLVRNAYVYPEEQDYWTHYFSQLA